ncbi:hypothetical protein [Longibacter sp.]|uniref:hypothetical protein n=1 Tax=Longibacter sp. TaxID=2045415 RepID=UPI003EBF2418
MNYLFGSLDIARSASYRETIMNTADLPSACPRPGTVASASNAVLGSSYAYAFTFLGYVYFYFYATSSGGL